jgi:serine protease AprX
VVHAVGVLGAGLVTVMRRIGIRMALVAAVALVGLAGSSAAHAARPAHVRAGEFIVQFAPGTRPDERRTTVRAAGGSVVRDLHVIRGLGVRLSRGGARRLSHMAGVHAVTPNIAMRSTAVLMRDRWAAWDSKSLATAYNQSTRTDMVWTDPKFRATGLGVAVAVIDTGIAGGLPDFRASDTDPTSRVVASVVTNPDATTSTDVYGHGTHVAGLVAGNGRALDATDPLWGRYVGTAPSAKLVSVKASDDHGNAYVMDVIAGLQFVVDHGADYGVRVVNLSLGTSVAMPYAIDPLDAAVEAAWAHGIVVVAAAGNRGTDPDAVWYAPANDPYAITVGAVDDHGTKDTSDDSLSSWSSRGVTQDGFAKPDLVAPGAHIVAPLAPDSDFGSLCLECVVDGRYFRVGGTSMAAPIVAGIAADILSVHPDWTPDQVKGALTYNGATGGNLRLTADGAWEAAADSAIKAAKSELIANTGRTPSWYLDPATGAIDATRASWGRASWRAAADALRASWGAASWQCDCPSTDESAIVTRASWRRASWRTFFGESPSDYGELSGGKSGRVTSPAPQHPTQAGPTAPVVKLRSP